MTLPVLERIAVELVERLEEITTANGYSLTVAGVLRPSRLAWESSAYKNKTLVVMQGENIRVEELDCFGNPGSLAWQVTFNVHCVARQDDSDSDSFNTLPNELDSCVRKAVADANNWHQFSGLAVNAEFGTTTHTVPAEGEASGAVVPIIITYKVSETDPYEVRA